MTRPKGMPLNGTPYLMIAYIDDAPSAESSPPVEPVIVFKLVYLDSLFLVRRRHYQRHGQSPLPANSVG